MDYDEELKETANTYKAALEAEHCLVHIRAKRSSNKDLEMLSRMTQSQQFKRVNVQGAGIESVITNSAYIAALLEKAQCTTREGVERLLEDEVQGKNWNQEVRGFDTCWRKMR